MEHPYLFFVKIFEAIGLGHFAHTYPHVVYSWVLMAILIICGAIATKTISMIPGKAQNLFEVIVSGIEEFMVETAGEEARWLFPLAATIFLYIFIGNLIGIIPGFFRPPPTSTPPSCASSWWCSPISSVSNTMVSATSNTLWGRSGGWRH
jgi:F-type H+-transporting ATPase subunit a